MGPLDRLHVEAPTWEDASRNQVRLDQRVTMMLMGALPEGLRNELISNRQLHCAGVVFKVLKTYPPGGLSERAMTLAAITQTKVVGSAMQAAESLRLWKRQVIRAGELQATLPDPTLQVRALDTIMEELLAKDSQASFRVSSFRMRFCGFEIRKTGEGFNMTQESYIRDMLRRHQVESTEHSPLPKVEEGEDEEDKKDLREAQMLTGELNWVTQRSRPDLAYATGLVSRLLHRRPTYACRLAWQVMKYLKATPERGLRYKQQSRTHAMHGGDPRGPWRTRHLRLRAAKLREAIQDEDGEWTAHHLRERS